METLSTHYQPFFDWLLRSTFQASIVVCLILLIQRALRSRLTARWHYALWLILVIRMVLPWAPQSRFSIFNLAVQQSKSNVPGHVMSEVDSESLNASGESSATQQSILRQEQSIQKDGTTVAVASDVPSRSLAADPATQPAFRLLSVLPFLWLAGVLLLGGYIIICNLTLLRAVGIECPSTDKEILELLEDCRSEIGLRTIVALVPSEKVNTPILLGFIRPRLLVPKSITKKLTREELRYVFLHELAHVKRHDIALGWLTALLQVTHWFNPLIWLAFHRMRSNRELACDALVLSRTQGEGTQDYGRAIVSLLEHFSLPQSLPGLAGILESKSQLKRRIAMITQFKKNSYKWSPLAVILIIMLGCVSLPDAERKEAAVTSVAKSSPATKAALNGKPEVTIRKVWSFKEPGRGPQSDNSGAPSPDGRYLSFCNWNYGDLAIRDLITGECRDLTDGGQDWEGRVYWAGVSVWSPDGKQIAYAWVSYPDAGKPHELCTIGLDGSEPRVLYRIESRQGAYITPRAWSQDGKFILADLQKPDGSKEIVLVSVADGSVRVLKSLERSRRPNWRMTGKSLSSDGRCVAYERPVKEDNNSCDIFLLATDGSGKEVPLVKHPADDYGPVWAPDGKTIAFVSDRSGSYDVWLMQVADSKPAGEPRLVKRDVGSMRPMGFTREGSLYCGLSGSSTDVYVASIDPTTGKVLAPPAKAIRSFEGSNRSPAWSPDGKNLAYVSQRPSPGSSHRRDVLVIRSVETGQERELYPGVHLEDLRWSPDGRSILCGGSLQLIDIQTGNITNLVDLTKIRNGEAKWSHDGKAVFYIRREEGLPRRIMARDLETGKEKELWQGGVGSLGISPDGRRLAFVSEKAIKVMPTTGGESRILHRQQDGEGFTCSPTWTTDGRHVLFGKRKHDKPGPMGLWRVPAEGGEPQELLALDGLEDISVHPDGRRIALTGGCGTLMEVWAMENFLPESTTSK